MDTTSFVYEKFGYDKVGKVGLIGWNCFYVEYEYSKGNLCDLYPNIQKKEAYAQLIFFHLI